MKKCTCWCLLIIELKNARWNIEITDYIWKCELCVLQKNENFSRQFGLVSKSYLMKFRQIMSMVYRIENN